MVLQTHITAVRTEGAVTTYDIRVVEQGQEGGRETLVRRRFSEFRQIDKVLSSSSELSRSKLPHRNLFGFRRKFNICRFNEHRQEGLEKYLSHLAAQVQSLQDNSDLAKFLHCSEEAPPKQGRWEPDIADEVHGDYSCSQSTCDSQDAGNGTTPRLSLVSAQSEQNYITLDSNRSVSRTAVLMEENDNADPALLLQDESRTATLGADLDVSVSANKNRDSVKLSPRRARLTNSIRGRSPVGIVAARVKMLESKEIESPQLQRRRHTISCSQLPIAGLNDERDLQRRRHTVSCSQLPATGLDDERDLLSPCEHSYLGAHPTLDRRQGFEESSISFSSVVNDGVSTLPDNCGNGCTVETSCGHHAGSSASSANAAVHQLTSDLPNDLVSPRTPLSYKITDDDDDELNDGSPARHRTSSIHLCYEALHPNWQRDFGAASFDKLLSLLESLEEDICSKQRGLEAAVDNMRTAQHPLMQCSADVWPVQEQLFACLEACSAQTQLLRALLAPGVGYDQGALPVEVLVKPAPSHMEEAAPNLTTHRVDGSTGYQRTPPIEVLVEPVPSHMKEAAPNLATHCVEGYTGDARRQQSHAGHGGSCFPTLSHLVQQTCGGQVRRQRRD